jgi:hypothetical protein
VRFACEAGKAIGIEREEIWLPMLVFEVMLGLWFIVKGVAPPARTSSVV